MSRFDQSLWAYVSASLERRQIEDAIGTLTALAEKSPEDAMVRRACVIALMEAERYQESLAHLEWLYARDDGKDSITLHRFATALHCSGKFSRCLDICNEAIALYPQFSQMYSLRGGTWQAFGEFDKMMADCRKGAALDSNNLHAQYALALRELMVSNLTRGFEGYSERMFDSDEEPIPFYDIPSWEGEDLDDKILLLIWEQGVGDMVMFASLFPYLKSLGARLIITVPQKMHMLFARSFPGCEVVVVRDGDMVAQLSERAHYSVLMGNLIEMCLPKYRPVKHPPYLKANPDRIAELRKKYIALDSAKKRLVGIAWHTTNAQTGIMRTIALSQWQPLFDISGAQFICLQYSPPEALPPALYRDPDIDAFADIDGLAAQIAAMDEVITIQNATAHLAGALGIPTTLLLSSASDWRWGVGSEKSAWYDTVQIVRQKDPLIWQPVMEQVAASLRTRIGPA